jgi:hypothetical protein
MSRGSRSNTADSFRALANTNRPSQIEVTHL